jgi:geranylgeranylglycerol-phosphate geranylgeranyltransferase
MATSGRDSVDSFTTEHRVVTAKVIADKKDLIDCIDRGLRVFASDEARAEYWKTFLASKITPETSSPDDRILENPSGFMASIEETFGLGAWAIDRAITKEIRVKFALEPQESRGMVQAIGNAVAKLPKNQQLTVEIQQPIVQQKRRPILSTLRSFVYLARSEYRVTMFVWAVVIAYLLATNLKPDFLTLGELIVTWYFVSLGVYVFNALSDVEEDRIDHPTRPLAAKSATISDAWRIFVFSIAISFVTAFLVSVPCLVLMLTAFLLGVAYSHPSIRAKRRFGLKVVVSAAGAAIVSICSGVVAGNLDGPVLFSALFFGMFSMVTLLLGDISDIPGDKAAGVRSIPVVIGPRNSILLIACIPMAIAFIGVAFFKMVNLNPLFPILMVVINAYSTLNIVSLLGKYDDYELVRHVKTRMRLVHFLIQFSILVGLLVI